MELLIWSLVGALIGVAAAKDKGFPIVGGVIGVLLLGPTAVMMFFLSGVSRGDARKKCPD